MRLGELDADGPAADDEQALRPSVEIEDRLVGQVGDPVEAGDRRHRRTRADGEHEPARLDRPPAGDNRRGVGEARLRGDHLNPESREALGGIVGRDGCDDAPDVIAHAAVIHRGLAWPDPERGGRAGGVGARCGRDQRLRGDAADIEALAAHAALLDEDHGHAEGGGDGGDRQAPRARSDHAQIRFQNLAHADADRYNFACTIR